MRIVTHNLLDGIKNCAVQVVGSLEKDEVNTPWTTVIDLSKFSPVPRQVRVEHLEWAITGRVEVLLAWHSEGGERELIVPLGGRGSLSFSDYGGLTNKLEGRSGHIELCTQDSDSMKKGAQHFVLFIDLTKQ